MITPPPDLAQVIAVSATRFAVPPDLLVGVWIKESGGNYPNVAVNEQGYGGLFGTKLWNGSPQAQADLAAQTLAYWYAQSGSWSTALYHYSGGGYTSVVGFEEDDFMALSKQDVEDAFYNALVRAGLVGGTTSEYKELVAIDADVAGLRQDEAKQEVGETAAEANPPASSPVGQDVLPTPPAPTP